MPPGRRRPSRSAASTMARATRSLMEPVGFWFSSLTKSWQRTGVQAGDFNERRVADEGQNGGQRPFRARGRSKGWHDGRYQQKKKRKGKGRPWRAGDRLPEIAGQRSIRPLSNYHPSRVPRSLVPKLYLGTHLPAKLYFARRFRGSATSRTSGVPKYNLWNEGTKKRKVD